MQAVRFGVLTVKMARTSDPKVTIEVVSETRYHWTSLSVPVCHQSLIIGHTLVKGGRLTLRRFLRNGPVECHFARFSSLIP